MNFPVNKTTELFWCNHKIKYNFYLFKLEFIILNYNAFFYTTVYLLHVAKSTLFIWKHFTNKKNLPVQYLQSEAYFFFCNANKTCVSTDPSLLFVLQVNCSCFTWGYNKCEIQEIMFLFSFKSVFREIEIHVSIYN